MEEKHTNFYQTFDKRLKIIKILLSVQKHSVTVE